MATKHVNASTLTVASILFTVDKNVRPLTPVTIYNGHSASIFIGDSTITTSGATIGRTIATTTTQTLDCNPGDVIYGISASASTAGIIVITYTA